MFHKLLTIQNTGILNLLSTVYYNKAGKTNKVHSNVIIND